MTTRRQDIDLTKKLCANIAFDAQIVIEWAQNNLEPEDVFDSNRLGAWAENNGYIKRSKLSSTV